VLEFRNNNSELIESTLVSLGKIESELRKQLENSQLNAEARKNLGKELKKKPKRYITMPWLI